MRESQLAIFCHVLSGASVAVWRNGSCEKEKETVHNGKREMEAEKAFQKNTRKRSLSPLSYAPILSVSLSLTHTPNLLSHPHNLLGTQSLSV